MKRETFTNKCIKNGIYDPDEFLCKEYERGLSCNEISEKLFEKHGIKITAKGIYEKIKDKTKIRTYSERKRNAISRGRMIYYKKPASMKYKSSGISAKIRYEVMERDGFKCQKCGGNAQSGHVLELHHKNGKESTLENLTTLCFLCHRGLHYNG